MILSISIGTFLLQQFPFMKGRSFESSQDPIALEQMEFPSIAKQLGGQQKPRKNSNVCYSRKRRTSATVVPAPLVYDSKRDCLLPELLDLITLEDRTIAQIEKIKSHRANVECVHQKNGVSVMTKDRLMFGETVQVIPFFEVDQMVHLEEKKNLPDRVQQEMQRVRENGFVLLDRESLTEFFMDPDSIMMWADKLPPIRNYNIGDAVIHDSFNFTVIEALNRPYWALSVDELREQSRKKDNCIGGHQVLLRGKHQSMQADEIAVGSVGIWPENSITTSFQHFLEDRYPEHFSMRSCLTHEADAQITLDIKCNDEVTRSVDFVMRETEDSYVYVAKTSDIEQLKEGFPRIITDLPHFSTRNNYELNLEFMFNHTGLTERQYVQLLLDIVEGMLGDPLDEPDVSEKTLRFYEPNYYYYYPTLEDAKKDNFRLSNTRESPYLELRFIKVISFQEQVIWAIDKSEPINDLYELYLFNADYFCPAELSNNPLFTVQDLTEIQINEKQLATRVKDVPGFLRQFREEIEEQCIRPCFHETYLKLSNGSSINIYTREVRGGYVFAVKTDDFYRLVSAFDAEAITDQDDILYSSDVARAAARLAGTPGALFNYLVSKFGRIMQPREVQSITSSLILGSDQGYIENIFPKHLVYNPDLEIKSFETNLSEENQSTASVIAIKGRVPRSCTAVILKGKVNRKIPVREVKEFSTGAAYFSASIPAPLGKKLATLRVIPVNDEEYGREISFKVNSIHWTAAEKYSEARKVQIGIMSEAIACDDQYAQIIALRELEKLYLADFNKSPSATIKKLTGEIAQASRVDAAVLTLVRDKLQRAKDQKFKTKPLSPYQKYLALEIYDAFIRGDSGFILGSPMGSGKTRIALAAAELIGKANILAPNKLVSNWHKEARQVGLRNYRVLEGTYEERDHYLRTNEEHPPLITNIDYMRQLAPDLNAAMSKDTVMTIVEEADFLSSESQQSWGVQRQILKTPFCLYVSGTPYRKIEHLPKVMQMVTGVDANLIASPQATKQLLNTEEIDLSYWSRSLARHGFFLDIEDIYSFSNPDKPRARQRNTIPQMVAVDNLGNFSQSPEQVEAEIALCTDYPRFLKDYLNLDQKERLEAEVSNSYLAKLYHLRRILNRPESIGIEGLNPKDAHTDQIVWQEIDHLSGKIIINCSTREDIQRLANRYTEKGYKAVHYYSGKREGPYLEVGEAPTESLDDAVSMFDTDPDMQILLITHKSGLRGLNLQAGSAQVYYDLPFEPVEFWQGSCRTQRLGSPHHTVRSYIVTADVDRSLVSQHDALFSKGTFDQRLHSFLLSQVKKLKLVRHNLVSEDVLLSFDDFLRREFPYFGR